MKRNLVIRLNDLPPRPQKLSPEALSKVFGGCSTWFCGAGVTCCPGYTCYLGISCG